MRRWRKRNEGGRSRHTPRFRLISSVRRHKSLSRSAQLETAPAIDPSILSFLLPETNESENPYAASHVPADFDWYLKWLWLQVSKLPKGEASLLAKDADSGTTILAENSKFYETFLAINQIARSQDSLSIDDIQEKLIEEDIFLLDSASPDVSVAQRRLVLAMLGWQSMLFLPAFDTKRPSSLNIYRAPGQPNTGLVFDNWSIPIDLTDRPLAILLKAFGNLLPARSSPDDISSELSKQAISWTSLSSSDVNAYLLHTILRVNIQWVDTMSLHLDYDKSTRSLSIFRHPSFCLAMLQSKGAIYAFASRELNPIDPRATSEEITHFLQEILLSYRLLFGQAKTSRRFFKNMFKSETVLSCNPDPLLRALCRDQHFAHSMVPPDRTLYLIDRDFPVLGRRVERLADELKVTKPKSLIDLLHDRRDTLQYWTFWLVAIGAGASILLGIFQVILAAIQVSQGG